MYFLRYCWKPKFLKGRKSFSPPYFRCFLPLSPQTLLLKVCDGLILVAVNILGSPALTDYENSKWFWWYRLIHSRVMKGFDPQNGLSQLYLVFKNFFQVHLKLAGKLYYSFITIYWNLNQKCLKKVRFFGNLTFLEQF